MGTLTPIIIDRVHHGERDDIIPISASQKMVDALTKAHADEVKFSRYPEAAHDSWTKAYNDIEVWQWMLKLRRGQGRREIGEENGVVVPEANKVQVA